MRIDFYMAGVRQGLILIGFNHFLLEQGVIKVVWDVIRVEIRGFVLNGDLNMII